MVTMAKRVLAGRQRGDGEFGFHGGAVERAEELRVGRGAVGVALEGGGVEQVDLLDDEDAAGEFGSGGGDEVLEPR